MTNEEITSAFMDKGWEIRYRGGDSKCTTPNETRVLTELPRKHRVYAPNLPGAERWLYGEAQARTRGREDR